jgi:putative copper resistance protein D
MAWFLKDFALFSVILNAATLAFESLVLGGLFYVAVAGLPAGPAAQPAMDRCRRGIGWAALALAIAQILFVAVNTFILVGTIQISIPDVSTADFFVAGIATVLASLALFRILRFSERPFASRRWFLVFVTPLACILLLTSVWRSHSVSRLDDRLITAILTGLHQFAVAAWVGGLPFLLASLRVSENPPSSRLMASRFSKVAITSVATMIATGVALSYFFIGSWHALYGTAYGFMVLTKIALLVLMLMLGWVNYQLARLPGASAETKQSPENFLELRELPRPLLALRRLGEAEIGIGFTIILAAASLTSQPPAVDLVQDRLTAHEIVERMTPKVPRLAYPVEAVSPATPFEESLRQFDNTISARATHKQADVDDSEASHHWAGMILVVVSLGAWLSRSTRFPWARYWPLGFIALSIFLFIRVDPENWPMGTRSFLKSFYDPEVLEHRMICLLLIFYAIFEAGVQTGRLKSRIAASVFPIMIVVSGALLLLHSHALGNVKEELLIEMNHNAIAVFAVLAGWTRLVEVRLPPAEGGRLTRIAGFIWPVCLVVIALLLLNYREA